MNVLLGCMYLVVALVGLCCGIIKEFKEKDIPLRILSTIFALIGSARIVRYTDISTNTTRNFYIVVVVVLLIPEIYKLMSYMDGWIPKQERGAN